jgi:hypothetical protein
MIKRSGAASVAALVAWNISVQHVRATGEGGDAEGSEEKFLVCTQSPTTQELNSPASVDTREIDGPGGNDLVRRVKTDQLVASGRVKGSFVLVPGAFSSPIQGTTTTKLKLQEPNGSGGWTDIPNQEHTRSATESQSISATKEAGVIYTAEAVVDGLEDSNGQSGALQGSAVSGGIGIDHGKMSTQTAWAGTEGGYTISFTVGISPASVKVDIAGTSVASTMIWSKPGLEWAFAIMTREQLEQWQEQNP